MRRLELRLADWHRLYKELQKARDRLQRPEAEHAETAAALLAEARRLQEECDAALADIHEKLQSGRGEQQRLPW
jgi:hypothetical protein